MVSRRITAGAVAAVAALATVLIGQIGPVDAAEATSVEYTVLAKSGVSADAAIATSVSGLARMSYAACERVASPLAVTTRSVLASSP